MNRKQKRWLRKHRNRENYLRNRRHWSPVGPVIVMDDPTDEHVKALLMEWISPREILKQVEQELAQHQNAKLQNNAWDFLAQLAGSADLQALPAPDLWRHVLRGALVDTPRLPTKIALA